MHHKTDEAELYVTDIVYSSVFHYATHLRKNQSPNHVVFGLITALR